MPRTPSTNLRDHIREHGPTTTDEFPYETSNVSLAQRRDYDLCRLMVRTSHKGTGRRSGQQVTVWYIDGETDAEAVVRRYIEENPGILNRTKGAVTSLFNRTDERLGDAWREIADEYDDELRDAGGGGGGSGVATCPVDGCETELTPHKLPDHIGDVHG